MGEVYVEMQGGEILPEKACKEGNITELWVDVVVQD